MPLVDITLNPRYRLGQRSDENAAPLSNILTRTRVKEHFARDLPALLVRHGGELGLAPETPPEAVQVMQHEYGEDDVNVANLWVKLQFSEDCPELNERHRIRDRVYELLIGWFWEQGFEPENFIVDLFWGPTNGRGAVNGVDIEW